MDDEQLEKLLRVVPTRRDLLTILDALAEANYVGEITAVQIYASKVRQVLLRKWRDEGTLTE